MVPSATIAMPAKKSRKGIGGRPKAPEPLYSVGSLKGRKAFIEWAERLFDYCRVDTTTGLEHGLIELAKARGFKEDPPLRK